MGYFNPNAYMTRAEVAVILYRLLSETVPVTVSYTDVPANSWYADAARQMLSAGRGNCYCYASVFWYLARWLGYDAKIFSGAVLGTPHSWVEIDGYIYDTQLEWRYVHDYSRSQYLWTFYHLLDSKDAYRYRK